jgi:hypothetical protein
MEKDAFIYSPACRIVKYTPNAIVTINAWIVFDRVPSIILWCAQVTVTPDANNTAVFRSGILNGFKVVIPTGGHVHPNSGVGASLLWKKAQKKAKKKHTSDKMNNSIPYRSPVVTYEL